MAAKNRNTENSGATAADPKPELNELLVVLNKMTDVMHINSKKGYNASYTLSEEIHARMPNNGLRNLKRVLPLTGRIKDSDKISSAMQLKLEENALSRFQTVPNTVKKDSGQLFQRFRNYFGPIHPK